MDKIILKKVNHSFKVGDDCPGIKENISKDCLFIEDGEIIGFYLQNPPEKIKKITNYCNSELLSKNVPKSMMKRSSALSGKGVLQYSTIIGSIPPKPHMRRPYPSISSVHSVKSAENFVKGMKLLGKLSEDLIMEIMPLQYQLQQKLISENVPEKYRFGKLFTSSISNYNISAPFHIDKLNIKNCLNVIIYKRDGCVGGNTYVPDYDACINSSDNSILVYPAWKNLHGVTPINKIKNDGYRNSLVFYPLNAFGEK